MKTASRDRAKLAFEKSLINRPTGTCVLRLFVAGVTARSQHAIMLVRQLCEVELKGNSSMEVIDIYQQPDLARINQIVATPTLLKEYPRPVRRFIGNLLTIKSLGAEFHVAQKNNVAP